MIGAIGRGTLRAAGQPGLDALLEEWTRDVRQEFGDVVGFYGRMEDDPGGIVLIILFSDEGTFKDYLQHTARNDWARKFMQHLEGEIDWEEIEVNQV